MTGATKTNYQPKIMFDGANGVGAPAMAEFNKLLGDVLEVQMVNQGEGELNSGCGADYVKVNSKHRGSGCVGRRLGSLMPTISLSEN